MCTNNRNVSATIHRPPMLRKHKERWTSDFPRVTKSFLRRARVNSSSGYNDEHPIFDLSPYRNPKLRSYLRSPRFRLIIFILPIYDNNSLATEPIFARKFLCATVQLIGKISLIRVIRLATEQQRDDFLRTNDDTLLLIHCFYSIDIFLMYNYPIGRHDTAIPPNVNRRYRQPDIFVGRESSAFPPSKSNKIAGNIKEISKP